MKLLQRNSKEEKLRELQEQLPSYRSRFKCKFCQSENTLIVNYSNTLSRNYMIDENIMNIRMDDVDVSVYFCVDCGRMTIKEHTT
jgi:hypothetical protein